MFSQTSKGSQEARTHQSLKATSALLCPTFQGQPGLRKLVALWSFLHGSYTPLCRFCYLRSWQRHGRPWFLWQA